MYLYLYKRHLLEDGSLLIRVYSGKVSTHVHTFRYLLATLAALDSSVMCCTPCDVNTLSL